MIGGSNPAKEKRFPTQNVQTGSGAHQGSYSVDTSAFTTGVKGPEREAEAHQSAAIYPLRPYALINPVLSYHVRFDTTATVTPETVFWNATPCGLFETYQRYPKISVIMYMTIRRHAPN